MTYNECLVLADLLTDYVTDNTIAVARTIPQDKIVCHATMLLVKGGNKAGVVRKARKNLIDVLEA